MSKPEKTELMNTHATMMAYQHKLETLLAEDFYAGGGDLAEQADAIAGSLPEDLAALLRDLAARGKQLNATPAIGDEALEFAFRCGQALERLNAFKLARVGEFIAGTRADGLPVEPLVNEEMDTLARLLAARDRALQAIADFTLKALLVCLGLLVLWVLVNLI